MLVHSIRAMALRTMLSCIGILLAILGLVIAIVTTVVLDQPKISLCHIVIGLTFSCIGALVSIFGMHLIFIARRPY